MTYEATSTDTGDTCCTWWRVFFYDDPQPPGFPPNDRAAAIGADEIVDPRWSSALRAQAPEWHR